ncbi:putative Poxvirus D5 protein [Monocercomonoides exilis]|uniref:putative Poxvirus D5 protein n=1 Tax=Monocercomonoides exilis TaxID=2049356 RepID=UPI00355A3C9A|nr:putative Poxvirus D5 protein [Monocercomonoides exilis]|eukprot:MONOS_16068.1-p1 / transcript=MONOS_16068.1 / gene=MONOS_16068 / organism=Monocercomonoides_exilis_PA203 / gene_product=Poxvirus D5 protein / transcript_product=Poxvirus D5 protein / location=Mono_scaffold01488:1150-1998(+) / protein_length=282 / sequence_SO=supercontig / SO=protein_coding / is_pseudo=false
MTDIRRKAETKQYKNADDVISDLSRVIRFIETGAMYIQKDFNIFDKRWGITFVTDTNMTRNLKMIKLWKTEHQTTTAYDILLSCLSKLTLQGVMFNAKDTANEFSIFQGFKYNLREHVDMETISMFLDFVREVIADSNNDVYEYVINWIANIVQHPGIKNETALILKGIQGIGKNRFTDVISELFAGYSSRNVTEVGELTGNFNSVVESKMLIVLNELKNCGDDRLANFNALKSVITENIIRINEKNQPRRTAENVANFIFVTNHSFPVKIETGDRRYVVLA